MSGYPKSFTIALYVTAAVLFSTGCLLIPRVLDQRLEMVFPWTPGGAVNLAAGAMHVGAAFLIAAFVGALWPVHMRRYWWENRNRRSGSTFVAVWIVLAITSIGVLYLGNEQASLVASVAHSIIGLAMPVVFAVHVLRGWKSRALVERQQHGERVGGDRPRASVRGA